MADQAEYKQNQENEEQNLRNAGGGKSYTPEAKQPGNYRDNEENQRIVKHSASLLVWNDDGRGLSGLTHPAWTWHKLDCPCRPRCSREESARSKEQKSWSTRAHSLPKSTSPFLSPYGKHAPRQTLGQVGKARDFNELGSLCKHAPEAIDWLDFSGRV
jgi:hypothetical protein